LAIYGIHIEEEVDKDSDQNNKRETTNT